MELAIDRLIRKINETGSPICVGLDPQPELLPPAILSRFAGEMGQTPEAIAGAFLSFNKGIIDAVKGIVPCVKPQIAMYERYGAAGVGAYTETVKYAKSQGFIVIGDIKRGDVASTAAAYSDGHIGQTDIGGEIFEAAGADFITINAYLGRDSAEPFFENCRKYGKGLFILVRTSNPGGADVQDLELKDGRRLYEEMGSLTAQWGKSFIGSYNYSSIGAVVGATWPGEAKRLREELPGVFFLVPGYGAQGGTAKDVSVCFDKDGLGAVVNSSRGIIGAWKNHEFNKKYSDLPPEEHYTLCAKDAVLKMREDLRGYIKG